MKRFVALCGFLVLQAGLVVFGPSVFAAEPPPFLKIMEDNFSGKKNIHKAVKKGLEADTLNWVDVTTLTKQYSTAALQVTQHAKTKPEKGDSKSWAKLSMQMGAQAKDLDAAVTKKDKDKALAAIEKLHETCEACHENHR